MPTDRSFTVLRLAWEEGRRALRPVRQAVFIEEQQVPPELEWNEGDDRCRHVLARDRAGGPIGTGRIDGEGHIGRVAVLRSWRGQGVGVALLAELIAMASEGGLREVQANAQTGAIGFYEKQGFLTEGPEFLEAGIPHRLMRRQL